MAFAGKIGSVRGHRTDLLVRRDLLEKLGQHERATNAAAGDFDGPNFQRLLIDPEVGLAPKTAFGATVLAGMPLAFTLDLDTGAVDQEMQRAL